METVPVVLATAENVTSVEAPLLSDGSAQTIAPFTRLQPTVFGVSDMPTESALTQFDNTTPEAVAGPALLTDTVNTQLLVAATGLGNTLPATRRSAIGSSVVKVRLQPEIELDEWVKPRSIMKRDHVPFGSVSVKIPSRLWYGPGGAGAMNNSFPEM
jgi:hypothetical protein